MTAGNKAWVHPNIPKYEIGYCQSTWPDQKLGMTSQCISKYIILVSYSLDFQLRRWLIFLDKELEKNILEITAEPGHC